MLVNPCRGRRGVGGQALLDFNGILPKITKHGHMTVLSIFGNPPATFQALKAHPKWVLAFNLVVIFTIISSVLQVQFVLLPNRFEIYQRSHFTPEQIEDAEARITGVAIYILNILAPFVYVVINLVVTGLYFYLFFPVLKHDISFRRTFAVVAHASLVRIPGFAVRLPLMIIQKTDAVHTGLLLFFPLLSEKTFAFRMLARFDFFSLWEVILVGMGLAAIADWKKRYTVPIAIGSWSAVNLLFALSPMVR